ncbi:MAG: DUF3179 domain-containing (seleno)protein [Methyloligellaceae bacterium]
MQSHPVKFFVLFLFVGVGMALSMWGNRIAKAESIFAWSQEFPKTDFSKSIVPLSEVKSDGPRRDTIPPIHDPKYVDVKNYRDIGNLEPVISIDIKGDRRAFPLRILLWHEIVNDVIGGVPVLISYCPLCNSGVVFDRRLDDETIVFGNTGRIRHFDMVMYDLGTESWWQQFTGEAIVGTLAGKKMRVLPARVESVEAFRKNGGGKILVPGDPEFRPYGTSPFAGTDSARVPRDRYPYPIPDGLQPFDRVVVVGSDAWSLKVLREQKKINHGNLILEWRPGQNSIHDTRRISTGRDVGNVIVQRKSANRMHDAPYDITFAFAFAAFVKDGIYHALK